MRVFEQKLSAVLVGSVASFGKARRYPKSNITAMSEKTEIILRIFIKSLHVEYIKAVNDFMKFKFDLFKGEIPVFIEIRGRNVLHAEGYFRIEDYSEERIVLTSRENSVAVNGVGLTLCHLSDERISIEGRIDSFEFI